MLRRVLTPLFVYMKRAMYLPGRVGVLMGRSGVNGVVRVVGVLGVRFGRRVFLTRRSTS